MARESQNLPFFEKTIARKNQVFLYWTVTIHLNCWYFCPTEFLKGLVWLDSDGTIQFIFEYHLVQWKSWDNTIVIDLIYWKLHRAVANSHTYLHLQIHLGNQTWGRVVWLGHQQIIVFHLPFSSWMHTLAIHRKMHYSHKISYHDEKNPSR